MLYLKHRTHNIVIEGARGSLVGRTPYQADPAYANAIAGATFFPCTVPAQQPRAQPKRSDKLLHSAPRALCFGNCWRSCAAVLLLPFSCCCSRASVLPLSCSCCRFCVLVLQFLVLVSCLACGFCWSPASLLPTARRRRRFAEKWSYSSMIPSG